MNGDDEASHQDAVSSTPTLSFDAVSTEVAEVLESLCEATQSRLLHLLRHQRTRLELCERALRRGIHERDVRAEQQRVACEREIVELETRNTKLQQLLRREKKERLEEKEGIAHLWPDGLVLPTVLKPFEVTALKSTLTTDEIARARDAGGGEFRQLEFTQYTQQQQGLNAVSTASAVLRHSDGIDSGASAHDWDADNRNHVAGQDDDSDNTSESEKKDDSEPFEDKPLDPIVLRAQVTAELEKHTQLEFELAKCQGVQRALALQLLNASRERFEREREVLAVEDEERKSDERRKRKALLQEQAAAKAKTEALKHKSRRGVQPRFGKDSVATKSLALSKDDEVFERELEAFVLQERADRAYLATPLSLDPRVRLRHQLDEEYVHTTTMEAKVLEIEQLEFDLLEKSSLRYEEAKMKSESLTDLCVQVRARLSEVQQDIAAVLKTIAHLEIPLSPPTEPRPSADELQRASSRFVTLAPLDDEEDDDDDNEADAAQETGLGYRGSSARDTAPPSLERGSMTSEVVNEGMANNENEALVNDEAELRLFKSFVDAEQQWRDWKKEEATRIEEFAQATDRRTSLESVQRQLALDLALCESDAPFFATLAQQEKDVNAHMWQIQADSQVERVRFMIERAAREEATFQMNDRFEELNAELEAAQRLPLQALNVLERLALEDESHVQCDSLERQVRELQGRYTKELEAKARLIALESRSYAYAFQRLEEELKLFNEKQVLWDLNFALEDELQAQRKTIERLYQLMEDETATLSPLPAVSDANQPPQRLKLAQEEAVAVFDAKLQLVQQTRQFLLLCYERESRWRHLAAVALVNDASSDEWMTSMQRERHEGMMALLQEQHDAEVRQLKNELKLQHKVKAALHTEIDELQATLQRVRLAYQEASDHVREHAEDVIRTLKAEIKRQTEALRDERQRAQDERERLISEHDGIRGDLESRLLTLEVAHEAQRHWLTAAKRELHAQRVANEELVKAYASLEKRRAAETNDMRFRITSQIRKINHIEMWNLSLKLQATAASAERVQSQHATEKLVAQHKEQQRLLRQKNWRHRVTAQAVLTDVDLLFRFFADGLEILAGATPEINARLRANGAIEVLAQLAQHCCQPVITAVCAKALGLLSWNANVTARTLGWQAKRRWFSWVDVQSGVVFDTLAQQNVAFDAVADEKSVETNWLADPSDIVGAGESDSDTVLKSSKKLQFVTAWHHFDELQFPDGNSSNQEHIGLSPSVLKTLIGLCRSQVDSADVSEPMRLEIQRNALRSLALIVRNSRNTAIIGRMDGFIELLVELVLPTEPSEDAQVVCNAIHALGNLAFENTFNQLAITTHGGVSHLLTYCNEATDVDLILAATQALAHLSQQETSVCEVIFSADGVPLLARLCHSPRIYDTVELDVYEQIQTYAAQVIANIVAALDNDDTEGAHRSRSVATAILDADNAVGSPPAGAVGGVASFVLMCASCTRDVAYHATLVLGSIAQHDPIRAAIGSAGGVDALFLLADRPGDLEMVVQATWALANLTWNRDNQYRVARYLDRLLSICTLSTRVSSSNQEQESSRTAEARPELDAEDAIQDDAELARQIQEHGLCILANSLFYNDANRDLVASQRAWMQLLYRNCTRSDSDGLTLEHSARALCLLSYGDAIALALGSESNRWGLPSNGLAVFVRLCGHKANPLVQRHGLFGVINLCLHDANKPRMLDVPHGIETLVNLSGSTNSDVCEPALEALELLADVNNPLQRSGITSTTALAAADVKTLVTLLGEAASPALVAMISDAIADEVWKRPSAKVKLRNEHGLEKLLELCVRPLSDTGMVVTAAQERRLLVSCLWALRNSVSDNVRSQDVVGALGGVEQLVLLYDRQHWSEDVVEAVLAALVALVTQHARNSQQLVRFGLDVLLSLADSSERSSGQNDDADERERTFSLPLLVPRKATASGARADISASDASPAPMRHELQNAALARDLLHLVAPYNTVPGIGSVGGSVSSSPDKWSKARRLRQQHQPPHQQVS